MIKSGSMFSQILSYIDRIEFERMVRRHHADRGEKGFTCWNHFVSMLFCQLAQAKSIREICGGLAITLGKLKHVGMKDAPKKSTLAYANEHRPWEMYRDLFYSLLERFHGQVRSKHRFRFKNKLLSLDSSTISLCLSLFPWAKFRRTKGAVKLHVLLDHDGYFPTFVHITDGKRHDVRVARDLHLPSGSIVAMDRGYNDYQLFSSWTDQGVYFVTRQKDNAVYTVVEKRSVPANRNILSDEVILLTGSKAATRCPHLLRRVVVWDKREGREIVLLSNHLEFGATTIAAIYKDRWQIEIFFKTLKQNLKVKTFVGTSENALYIQIWTALIAILIIKYLQHLSKAGLSLSNLVAFLRWSLFTYRDLLDWLASPFEVPPLEPEPVQYRLPCFGQHV